MFYPGCSLPAQFLFVKFLHIFRHFVKICGSRCINDVWIYREPPPFSFKLQFPQMTIIFTLGFVNNNTKLLCLLYSFAWNRDHKLTLSRRYFSIIINWSSVVVDQNTWVSLTGRKSSPPWSGCLIWVVDVRKHSSPFSFTSSTHVPILTGAVLLFQFHIILTKAKLLKRNNKEAVLVSVFPGKRVYK